MASPLACMLSLAGRSRALLLHPHCCRHNVQERAKDLGRPLAMMMSVLQRCRCHAPVPLPLPAPCPVHGIGHQHPSHPSTAAPLPHPGSIVEKTTCEARGCGEPGWPQLPAPTVSPPPPPPPSHTHHTTHTHTHTLAQISASRASRTRRGCRWASGAGSACGPGAAAAPPLPPQERPRAPSCRPRAPPTRCPPPKMQREPGLLCRQGAEPRGIGAAVLARLPAPGAGCGPVCAGALGRFSGGLALGLLLVLWWWWSTLYSPPLLAGCRQLRSCHRGHALHASGPQSPDLVGRRSAPQQSAAVATPAATVSDSDLPARAQPRPPPPRASAMQDASAFCDQGEAVSFVTLQLRAGSVRQARG